MSDQDTQIERLGKLPIPVSVCVCRRTVTLNQFLNWTPGTILSFDQSAASPLQIQVGSHDIGEGCAVKLGADLGFRVHRIGQGCIQSTEASR